jgi:hypothetical protein
MDSTLWLIIDFATFTIRWLFRFAVGVSVALILLKITVIVIPEWKGRRPWQGYLTCRWIKIMRAQAGYEQPRAKGAAACRR